MSVISNNILAGAAGAAGAEALYVDDVFSTYLYDGTGSTQTITNGIDLSGEGGMVWFKQRDSPNEFPAIVDTERGRTKVLYPSDTYAEFTTTSSSTHDLISFNSDGFTLGNTEDINANHLTKTNVSWAFRKAPGFFDVVTYTGNGTAGRTVAHNLGSVPGMIVIKKRDGTGNWAVHHRSLGNSNALYLHGTNASFSSPLFNNTTPTSTEFTLNNGGDVNGNGSSYVAYIFAHDDQSFGEDGDESIIKCGSYTGTGGSGLNVNLGFEPQFVLVKNADSSGTSWIIFDMMRGMTDNARVQIYPDTSDAEFTSTSSHGLFPTATGFASNQLNTFFNAASTDYIYMAIRRPHKPPEAATDVFAIDTLGGTSPSPPGWTSGFPVDWEFIKKDNATSNWESITRLTMKLLYLNLSNAESSINSNDTFDHMTGWSDNTGPNANNFSWMFRRAPGFFDVVTYTGTGSAQNVNHNLEVTPELMIVKSRNQANWNVYSSALGATQYLSLNKTDAANTAISRWNDTAPTSSVFTVGTTTSTSGVGFIAYLFATRPGVSKVGSYTGNGSAQDINCGFTNGARFVMIKRTDDTGNWYVWDSVRGIVSGNDPYILLNTTDAEVTSADRIDPLSSGFRVDTTFNELNANGGTYLFLAIA